MILRVAQMEKPSYPVAKSKRPTEPRAEPDQIEETVRILGEDGPALPRAPQRKDQSRRKLTPGR